MKQYRIIAALCCLATSALGAGKKISDYTETLSIDDAWIYEIAVPGVTNFKVRFGTMATNIIARVGSTTNTIINSSGNLSFNTTNDTLQLIDTNGAYTGYVKLNGQSLIQFSNSTRLGFGVAGNTNWYINNDGVGDLGHWRPTLSNTYNLGSVTQSVKRLVVNDVSLLGVTMARPLFLDSSGNITNVSGTPNGLQFVRDDGSLAVPGGGGDVTTAQLNTSSNSLYLVERTNNAAVSNAVIAEIISYGTATSNALYTTETTRNAAVSNSVVTLSSNNVRVAAGTGTTVTSAGSGGVQTFTVNASGGVATNANQFGASTTLTIKDGALLTNLVVKAAGGASTALTVDTNVLVVTGGKVGIGTVSPTNALHVNSSLGPQAVFYGFSTAVGANAQHGEIRLGNLPANQARIQYDAGAGVVYIDNTYDSAAGDIYLRTRVAGTPVNALVVRGSGNVGIGTNAPGYKLEVNGTARITGAVMLNNGTPAAGQVATYRSDGTLYPSNVVAGATTQMVAAAIGTLTITNALSVSVLNVNQVNLTNALGSNVVRMGIQDMTNSAAMSPANGDALTWHSGMKKWTNSVPAGADVVSNITVSSTANILLDFGAANVFKIRLLTNWSQSFTNTSLLTKKAYVYYQQDTNGTRLLTGYNVAGGLLQTNANMQPTTNASALDLLEVMPGFFTTNLVAYWPQNFQPRVNFTNSITAFATASDTFTRANADPISNPMSDGVSTWTSGPGAMGDMKIESNVALRSGAGDSGMRVLAPTFTGNHKATITLDVDVGAVGPMVRMQGTGDASGYLVIVDDTTHLRIYKVTDTGTLANVALGSAMETELLEPGDTIGLSVNGTTLEAFVNGVSVGTTTDATWSGGQPGAWVTSAMGTIENFVSTDL